MARRKNSNVRKYYKALIKNLTRINGPVSRTTLHSLTGMIPASVTDISKELLKEGVLRESGYESSKRGRRKVLFDIYSDGGRVVAVDFNASRILGLGVDQKLGICYKTQRDFPDQANKDDILRSMRSILNEIIESPIMKEAPILGIGVADPGVVDVNEGMSIFTTQIRDWENVPLRDIISQEFNYPFSLENNTRCRLVVEKNMGVAKPYENILLVELSTGISAGVMSEGKLFRGSRGAAAEIGHMMVVENGPYCNCGSQGCLEALASSRAVVRHIQEAIHSGATSILYDMSEGDLSRIDINLIAQAVEDSDKLSLRIVEEAGRMIGGAIANAVNLYNPEIVVLTGELLAFGDNIVLPIEGTVRRQALSYNTRDLRIGLAEVGDEGAAWGMAALVLDKAFEVPELRLQGEEL
ncbi:MAG: ROK family protein [Candidatus Atribacteria bacterium]|nr:ROK family protein [Candidatus Atribacteria bacterium]